MNTPCNLVFRSDRLPSSDKFELLEDNNYKPENEMKATIEHCLICGVGLDDENVGSEDITLCEVCEFLEEELDYEEEE